MLIIITELHIKTFGRYNKLQADKTKKVYIINDLKSNRIEQVIFILKPGEASGSGRDLGLEAQDIINRYSSKIDMGIKSGSFVSGKTKKHNPLFKFLPIAAAAIFMFFIFKSLFC